VAAKIDRGIYISLACCECLSKIRWNTSPFSDIHYTCRDV